MKTTLVSRSGEDGVATIVRPRGTFVLDIAGTRAELETTSVNIYVRYRM